MSIQARVATEADIPAILDIYNEAVLNTTATADYAPQMLEARVAWYHERLEKNCPVYVAENETGQVIGWSSYGPYHARIGYRFTVENSVYVAAEARGQGVGKLLLAPLIETAQRSGLHGILASIDGSNEASIRLHAGFGFERVAHLKQVVYKFDRWLDVVYMQKLLEPPSDNLEHGYR